MAMEPPIFSDASVIKVKEQDHDRRHLGLKLYNLELPKDFIGGPVEPVWHSIAGKALQDAEYTLEVDRTPGDSALIVKGIWGEGGVKSVVDTVRRGFAAAGRRDFKQPRIEYRELGAAGLDPKNLKVEYRERAESLGSVGQTVTQETGREVEQGPRASEPGVQKGR